MANIQQLGTDYGGWTIDLDSIENNSTIIDAGLGEDISFSLELQKIKNVKIIGIDPTQKSIEYIKNLNLDNFELIEKAIAKYGEKQITMFKNKNSEHVSESMFSSHFSVKGEFYSVDCISFKELIENNHNISLIKMDIEGSEYDCLQECLGIKQVCVEFHDFCIEDKKRKDTDLMIKMMIKNGYEVLYSNGQKNEFTFILK